MWAEFAVLYLFTQEADKGVNRTKQNGLPDEQPVRYFKQRAAYASLFPSLFSSCAGASSTAGVSSTAASTFTSSTFSSTTGVSV